VRVPQDHVLGTAQAQQHLDDLVRVWLGVRDRRVAIPRLPDELARLVLRVEEYEQNERDAWGGWPADASESFRRGALRKPEIDVWLEQRRADLPPGTPLEPRWPSGRRFAVCLTHDVDLLSLASTPMQALRYARAGLAPGAGGRRETVARLARPAARLVRTTRTGISRTPSLRETLERSLDLERAHDATASYLFTVPPHRPRSRYDCAYAPGDRCLFRGRQVRVAEVMRELDRDGFDVGLHGGYGAASTPGALAAERATLEAATGLEITTTRQHFLRWDIRWTPLHQEAAGLGTDSTMGFNFDVGFRAGTSLPFRFFDVPSARSLDLLEVPLVAQDGAILGPSALGLSGREAISLLRPLFDSVSSLGGALTLLVHPDKLARPEWLALYEWCLDYGRERGAWLTSLRELSAWWRGRETRILA
jgi:hypothetical protein